MNKGYYSVSQLDLPRAVKFKPWRKKRKDYVSKGLKIGRSHEDYLAYMEGHQLESHVELDTVIGRIGGKVILTIHFTAVNFMIGLLPDNKTAVEAASKFSDLKNRRKHRHQ